MKSFCRFPLALAAFALLFFTSCTPAQRVPENFIAPAELTADQQEIIDLLSIPGNTELMLFDFRAEEAYRNIEFWVEVYQDGEVIDRSGMVSLFDDLGDRHDGHLAVIISHTDSTYRWTLSVSVNGSGGSHHGAWASEMPAEGGFGRAFGPIDTPAALEDGKECILYSSTFVEANKPHRAYDNQFLQENPERLAEYPYAFLIKCKFSRG